MVFSPIRMRLPKTVIEMTYSEESKRHLPSPPVSLICSLVLLLEIDFVFTRKDTQASQQTTSIGIDLEFV